MICICDYLGLSESSASHRLNDVQDVQDMARIQQESKYMSTHPSLIQKKFIKKIPSKRPMGSGGSSKLVLPNSELLLFERKFISKF